MAELTSKLPDELRKELRKELAKAARVIVLAQRQRVKGLTSSSGGSSATKKRATEAWSKRKTAGTQKQWDSLRKRSGLRNAAAASLRVINRTRGTGTQLTVKSEANKMPADQRKLPLAMNRGKWAHPVMGRPNSWVTQTVPPGWFDKPAEEKSPEVAAAVNTAIDKAISRLPG